MQQAEGPLERPEAEDGPLDEVDFSPSSEEDLLLLQCDRLIYTPVHHPTQLHMEDNQEALNVTLKWMFIPKEVKSRPGRPRVSLRTSPMGSSP